MANTKSSGVLTAAIMEFSSKFWDKKYCNSELPQLQLIVHSFIKKLSGRNPISDVGTRTGQTIWHDLDSDSGTDSS